MPGPYAPSTMVSDIVHQLAVYLQAQIPSIATVYEELPDKPPTHNSVLLPLVKSKVLSDTNGKVKVCHTFAARHIFRRSASNSNILLAYSYIGPWLRLASGWSNQQLAGLSITVTAKDVQVTQVSESGQVMMALVITIDVLTEFNADLT